MGMAAAQRIAGTTVQPDDCRHRRILISILSQGYGACPSIQPALGPIEIWVANIRIESATFLLGFLDVVHRNSLPIAGRRTDMRYESTRSEEHTSELQSLMRISYAVFCLKKNTYTIHR